MKYLIILVFTTSLQGQSLHHQMISSQGHSSELLNNILVKQTIGQQSLTGNSFNNEQAIVQGFQQNASNMFVSRNTNESKETIYVKTYPNPFKESVNFQFSELISEEVSLSVFDITGRLVFEQKKLAVNKILTINLNMLPISEYLVRLVNSNVNYFTKIIKKND